MARTTAPALDQWLSDQVPGYYRARDTTVPVSTTPVLVAPISSERLSLTLVCSTDAPLYLSTDPLGDTAKSIALDAAGKGVSLSMWEDGALVGVAWYAWAASADSSVYVLESIRYQGEG